MLIKQVSYWRSTDIEPSYPDRRILVYTSTHNNPYRILKASDLRILTDAEWWTYLKEPKSNK